MWVRWGLYWVGEGLILLGEVASVVLPEGIFDFLYDLAVEESGVVLVVFEDGEEEFVVVVFEGLEQLRVLVVEVGDCLDDEGIALEVQRVHEKVYPVHNFEDQAVLDAALELAGEEEDLGDLRDVAGRQVLLDAEQQAVHYLFAVHESLPGQDFEEVDGVDDLLG